MAEEEKTQEGSSQEAPAGQLEGGQAEVKPEGQDDYEAKYKDLQSKHDKLQQEHEGLQTEYDAVKPFGDFAGSDALSPEGGENEDDELPVTRKESRQMIANFERRRQIERMTDKFLGANPDLRPYEDLVGNILMTKTDPKMPITKRLIDAGKKTRAFLETERQKGKDEETAIAEQRKKDEAAASGLGSAGTTSPKKSEQEKEQTSGDYIKGRKAQSAEGRGIPT